MLLNTSSDVTRVVAYSAVYFIIFDMFFNNFAVVALIACISVLSFVMLCIIGL